jgi:hypothetical protein
VIKSAERAENQAGLVAGEAVGAVGRRRGEDHLAAQAVPAGALLTIAAPLWAMAITPDFYSAREQVVGLPLGQA